MSDYVFIKTSGKKVNRNTSKNTNSNSLNIYDLISDINESKDNIWDLASYADTADDNLDDLFDDTSKKSFKSINILNIDEVRKAVNDLDKKFGIKLKHPNIWREPEFYSEYLERRADNALAAMICVLNGIKIEDWFYYDEKKKEYYLDNSKSINDKSFNSLSLLNWNECNKLYKTNSLLFRSRFATLVLNEIYGNIKLVAERESKIRYRDKFSITDRSIVLIKDIVDNCFTFSKLMIESGEVYKNSLLKMNEYILYTRKINHKRVLTEINKSILSLRRNMHKDLMTGESVLPDDMTIYYILINAFMMTTLDIRFTYGVPDFDLIENATVKHNLINLIEYLGVGIIKVSKKKKLNPLFKAFLSARPIIETQFFQETEDNYAVKVGVLALGFLSFVLNDRYCTKFIDKMLEKGK